MWLILSLFVLCQLAWAGDEYGVPPPPPPAPYPVPAPQYPPGPGYLPHHGHHHRHRYSDSHSDSEEECDDCDDLRAHCHGSYDTQCIRPKFRYVHSEHHDRPGHHKSHDKRHPHKPRKPCRQVVITCPRDGQYSLETSNYHQFFNGQGFSLLAKCSRRGKWEARDLSGNKASFTRIRCVSQGTSGYPNAPVYPPVSQPDYQPIPPPYPDSQPAPPPPVYSQ